MAYIHYLILLILLHAHLGVTDDSVVTQTVYGFLDFTTTIGNTVMVFSPQSAPALDVKGAIELPSNIIETKPIVSGRQETGGDTSISPTKLAAPPVKTPAGKSSSDTSAAKKKSPSPPSAPSPGGTSTLVAVNSMIAVSKPKKPATAEHHDATTETAALQLQNNLDQPEYDLLSRQPAEYAEETYRLVNLKSHARHHDKARPTNIPKAPQAHAQATPTQTGKYAAAGQSSSSVVYRNKKPKIRASTSSSASLRVLKTAAPAVPKPKSSSTRSGGAPGSRLRSKNSSPAGNFTVLIAESAPEQSEHRTTKKSRSRKGSKRRNKHGSSSSSSQRSGFTTTTTAAPPPADAGGRRSFRSKLQSTTAETSTAANLFAFKLNRTPGRWQYKTSPKPRVAIRNHVSESSPSGIAQNNYTVSTATSINDQLNGGSDNPSQNSVLDQGDLESSGSQNGAVLNNVDQEGGKRKVFVETLNVEISTPADFKDTYYEIATIKTPFIFQAGVVKKTRFITVTSTIEKVLQSEPTATVSESGPLSENILWSSLSIDGYDTDKSLLDGSITTLMTLHVSGDEETPRLLTVTESYSIATTKLRTQIMPVLFDKENRTTFLTLVQTYGVTSLITATKTLAPLETNQFIPSQSFKDFGGSLDEAGSEINLELEFGDEDNSEILHDDRAYTETRSGELEPKSNKSPVNVVNSPGPNPSQNGNQNLIPEQVKQLALLNLFNPNGQQPTVITTSYPVIKHETLWESHVVPIVNGQSTVFRTLSKSVGVVDRTEYKMDTTTLALPTMPQPPPQVSVNPYLLPGVQPQFHTITSSLVQQTIVTQTNSKVLKLTFGAKTAYTTIFSTKVVPTALTMLVTTALPVQQPSAAAFPGFYPPPYNPYAYLG